MRQIMAEPQGAPEIVTDCLSFERKGCEGKNDAKCFATQIGPTPVSYTHLRAHET